MIKFHISILNKKITAMATTAAQPSKDVHHKMSKKIAQLTKVIFHLHSKNEENVQYQNSLTGAYEKEIEIILKEANSIISRQKEALEKARDQAGIKAMIKDVEDRHTSERKET